MTGEPETTAPKQHKGFQPGKSGNPAGRPRGSRHRVTVLAEKLMSDDAETIVKAVLDAAQKGDMTAARLVLDRIAPARKGSVVMLELPSVTDAASAVEALGAITAAAAGGDISLDEAQGLAGLIETARRAIAARDGEPGFAEVQLINRPEGL